MFARKFGFRGPSMMEKQTHAIGKILLLNVVLVSVTVSAESICQFGFRYRI